MPSSGSVAVILMTLIPIGTFSGTTAENIQIKLVT